MSNNDASKSKKKGPQSEDKALKQNVQAKKNWTPANQKVDDLDLGTRMVNLTLGQEYEKRVNKMFQEKLQAVGRGFFKTNLKFQGLHEHNLMFFNWNLIHKAKTSVDDISKPKSQNVKDNNDEMPLPALQFYQKDEFVRNIEVDGAAFVSETLNGRPDFSIEIENQTLSFQAPCIILIEIAVMSDEGTMLKKLRQLVKDYVFVKSDSVFLRQLIADENGFQNLDQIFEAEKIFQSISPVNHDNSIKIYLVCATNNDREEGRESFEKAWVKVSEIFDLSMIDCLYNKQMSNPLDVTQFRKNHVKQIHVQSTPYSNFLSKINTVPEKIDKLETDVKDMKGDMANMKGEIHKIHSALDHILKLLENKKEDHGAKDNESPEEKELKIGN